MFQFYIKSSKLVSNMKVKGMSFYSPTTVNQSTWLRSHGGLILWAAVWKTNKNA